MELNESQNRGLSKEHIDELNDMAFQERHINSEASLTMARSALELSIASSYEQGKAKALLNIGFQEMMISEYEKAFSTFNKSLNVYLGIKDPLGVAHAYYNLGVLFLRLGEYDNAMEVQQKSLVIRKQSGDLDAIAACKSQTAYINAQFGLSEQALMDYDECIGIWRQNGNRAGLAGALMSLGGVLTKLSRFAEAKEQLLESLVIRKTLKEVNGWTGSANYLADVYIKEGNMDEAIWLLDEALTFALSQTPIFAPGVCRLRTNIAKVFIEVRDFEKAELHLEKALELALYTKQQYQLHDIYFELSKLYKLSFKYDKALAFYEQFHENKQKVINLNAATKLKNLEILNKVEITEKEVEIHRLKNIELKKRNKIIFEERKRSDNLLLNILPRRTAQELKKNGSTKPRSYELVTILFSDFVSFTATTEILMSERLVERLHMYFSAFDEIVTRNKIEKIKTIGDAYMATGGIPVANTTNPVQVATAALEMIEYVRCQNDALFQVRIGIHSGPVVAGVVGTKKFAYDIWGDTVNIASRMESSSTPGKVNISGVTYELIKDRFICHYRGKVEAKGKGMIDMYYIERQRVG